MTRLRRVAGLVAFLIMITPSLAAGTQSPPATTAQEPLRVFIAPIADFALGDAGPTRYEYINWLSQQECTGLVPIAREALADFTFWFEFEDAHYVLVWDAEGHLVGSNGAVLRADNIVKDACNIIWEHSESARESRREWRRLTAEAERQRLLEQRRRGSRSTPECNRLATTTPDEWRRLSDGERSALREACRNSR
jgi:hypothetical protein